MNEKDLIHAMNDIDDRFIEEATAASGQEKSDGVSPDGSKISSFPDTKMSAENNGKKGKHRRPRTGMVAGIIAACFVGVFALGTVVNLTRRSASSSDSYASGTADGSYSAAGDTAYDYDNDTDYYSEDSYADTEEASTEDSDYSFSTTDDVYEESASNDSGEAAADAADEEGEIDYDKLVYTCDLTIQTKDYASAKQAIQDKISAYNGIIQSETESNNDYYWYLYEDSDGSGRTGYLSWFVTIRIPSSSYEEFLSGISEDGKVISKTASVSNISREYHQTEAQVEALETQEEKLQEMMEQAETIEDMIAIESRLSEVEAELNYQKSYLASLDTDVAYSTINLSLQEVETYTPVATEEPSFGEKILQACKGSLENFVTGLETMLYAIIYLIPIAVAALVLFLIVRGILRHRKKRKAAKAADRTFDPDHK